MNIRTFSIIAASAVCLLSCGKNSNIIKDAPISFEKPGQRVENPPTKDISGQFPEEESNFHFVIVQDSLILFRQNIDALPEYGHFFRAYSLNGDGCIGSFLGKGRGPGEVLSPTVTPCSIRGPFASVHDLPSSRILTWDVASSINNGSTVITSEQNAPDGSLYAFPGVGDGLFVIRMDGSKIVCQSIDKSGQPVWSRDMYDESIDATMFYFKLGSSVTISAPKKKAALFMTDYPQINLVNLEDGSIKSVATGKECRKWKDDFVALNPEALMNPITYYSSSTSTDSVIMAVFGKSHIHVLDWNGAFLFDIDAKKNLSSIDYRKSDNSIYAMAEDGRILRISLPELN